MCTLQVPQIIVLCLYPSAFSFIFFSFRWSDHLFDRSIIPSSVGMFFFVWLVGSFFCSSLPFTHLLFYFFVLSLSFSLSFFPWCDRSSVHLIVPLYVFSSDRSLVDPVVRLSSRSIMRSFDRSYDDSFVGLINSSSFRSYLRLSVCFFCLARWFIFLFVPPFYSPSVLFLRSFSFLFLIVLSLV